MHQGVTTFLKTLQRSVLGASSEGPVDSITLQAMREAAALRKELDWHLELARLYGCDEPVSSSSWRVCAAAPAAEHIESQPLLHTRIVSNEEVREKLHEWRDAMKAECDSLINKGAVELVADSQVEKWISDGEDVEILPGRGVATEKPPVVPGATKRNKYRAVICGNFQKWSEERASESFYAGGADSLSIRTALRWAGMRNFGGSGTDVKTAFLNAPLDEQEAEYLICNPPKALYAAGVIPRGFKWRVHGALYGLQTSPRAWSRLRDKTCRVMTWATYGQPRHLQQCVSDPNIWLVKSSDGQIVALMKVLLSTVDLKFQSPLKVQGNAKSPCAAWSNEFDDGETRDDQIDPDAVKAAQSLTGELLWLSVRARPELSFPVSRMAQLTTKRPNDALSIGKGVLRFLNASPSQCIVYGPPPGDCGKSQQYPRPVVETTLHAFADASFGPSSGRSHQGLLVCWAGAPLHWESGRQTLTALSTAESELISYVCVVQAAEAVEALIGEIFPEPLHRSLFGDNSSAISIVSGPPTSWRMTPNAASNLPRPLPQDLPRTDLVPPPQDLAGAVAAAGPAPVLQQPSSQPQEDPGRWSRKLGILEKPSKKLASPPEVSPAGLSAASGSKDITVTSDGHQGGEEDDDLFDFQWPEGDVECIKKCEKFTSNELPSMIGDSTSPYHFERLAIKLQGAGLDCASLESREEAYKKGAQRLGYATKTMHPVVLALFAALHTNDLLDLKARQETRENIQLNDPHEAGTKIPDYVAVMLRSLSVFLGMVQDRDMVSENRPPFVPIMVTEFLFDTSPDEMFTFWHIFAERFLLSAKGQTCTDEDIDATVEEVGNGHFHKASNTVASLRGAFRAVTSSISTSRTTSRTSKRRAEEEEASRGQEDGFLSSSRDADGVKWVPKKKENVEKEVQFELRNVIFDLDGGAMGTREVKATRTKYDFDGSPGFRLVDGFLQAAALLKKEETTVFIRRNPFTRGGMRHCYGFRDPGLENGNNHKRMVAKKQKWVTEADVDPMTTVDIYAKQTAVAHYFARKFQYDVFKTTGQKIKLDFVPCYAYRPLWAEDGDLEGFCGEEFVSGEFVKLTSNAGFVNREEYGGHAIIGSAFSHYTFHWSNGALLVSDIQGVCAGHRDDGREGRKARGGKDENRSWVLSDPQVLTDGAQYQFGRGDLGIKGRTDRICHMKAGFRTGVSGVGGVGWCLCWAGLG
eukprot:s4729_g3.t1